MFYARALDQAYFCFLFLPPNMTTKRGNGVGYTYHLPPGLRGGLT